MLKFVFAILFGFNVMIFVGPVAHARPFSKDMFDSVSLYEGQGVNHNLRELPSRIISNTIQWDRTYFTALGLGKTSGTLGEDHETLRDTFFAPIRHGYELVLVKHYGAQNNLEVGAAYKLKTPDVQFGFLGANFSAGAGLSYAIGNPTYEDGPIDRPSQRYRLQLLLLFDIEWHFGQNERLSIVTRTHHRSGVYGLIAPRHVGSNFMAVGIRYKF